MSAGRATRRSEAVSIESGLEGRNNPLLLGGPDAIPAVSIESGLEGRNNLLWAMRFGAHISRLNRVRPRRPEQSALSSEPILRTPS